MIVNKASPHVVNVSKRGSSNGATSAVKPKTREKPSANKLTGRDGATVCGDCEGQVGDGENGILCDNCQKWYHAECEKINNPGYKLMTKAQNIQWYCGVCRTDISSYKLENTHLKLENSALRVENKTLRNRLTELEKRISEIKREIKIEIVEEVTEMIDRRFKDVGEIENKKACEKI